jgi:hypothetical protein
MDVCLDQDFLKLESASAGQSDVEHDASGCIGTRSLKKLLRRTERYHGQYYRLKKIYDAFTRRRVIIDDEYEGLFNAQVTPPLLDDVVTQTEISRLGEHCPKPTAARRGLR